MSQSPVDAADIEAVRDSATAYRQSLDNLNRILRHGGTLSGHEANCAFLNTRGGRFATVSAVSGFDFTDDGRGLALVDWDADGDVDVWTSNRTGPRVRFLRNDLPTRNHFVAFALEGRTCNRDAIGARVEVCLPDSSGGAITKSLRAGEGYLSQSSKWLLFGLGRQAALPRVIVRWPDGQVQHYTDLAVDRHYRLVQGQPEAIRWRRKTASLKIAPGRNDHSPSRDEVRVVLTQRIPLPRLGLAFDAPQPAAGTGEVHAPSTGRPLLVNLWATWCAPCLQELHDLTRRADALRAVQLDVLALNVDRLATAKADPIRDADQILKQLNFPFASGLADDELTQRLRTIHQLPFLHHVELPVPVSFLVDAQRRVAVIYRGPVDVDQLIADVRDLSLSDDRWSESALPLPGRWHQSPQPAVPLTVARGLMERRQLDDALEYVTRFHTELSRNSEFGKLLVWVGDELVAAGRIQAGLQQYEAALKADPDNVVAMNNLAWQLATHPDSQLRNGPVAVRWARKATKLTQARDAGVLDTLAASYAEAGRFAEAVKAAKRAIQLVEQQTDNDSNELTARMRKRLQGYEGQVPVRSQP